MRIALLAFFLGYLDLLSLGYGQWIRSIVCAAAVPVEALALSASPSLLIPQRSLKTSPPASRAPTGAAAVSGARRTLLLTASTSPCSPSSIPAHCLPPPRDVSPRCTPRLSGFYRACSSAVAAQSTPRPSLNLGDTTGTEFNALLDSVSPLRRRRDQQGQAARVRTHLAALHMP
ncbi:hypothetical protein MSAN_00777600 [Mycena sanguinolenta]|uniref:Uncharacterized protein n=1 Tax=Mycena sanguinolenta TaxID=230812 RepID=A0A8H7DEG9_9AGAR|nr:hypothetical protein MSAN_00777600 [Mycena sanguinolenta]